MIRALWVALAGGTITAVLAAQIVIAGWLGLEKTLRRICPRNPTWSAKVILWAAGVRVEVDGLDRLRGRGPRVVVANHESWFDVMALCANVPDEYRFAIKKELESVPIWGAAWVACGHISVDRQNRQAAIQALERARDTSGGSEDILIVFFPEGTRSPTGAMLPFKKGAFVTAIQLGVPVIPVAVIGGRQVMPKGTLRIRSGTMRLVVGEPIAEGVGFEGRDELMARSRAAIVEMRGGEGPTAAP